MARESHQRAIRKGQELLAGVCLILSDDSVSNPSRFVVCYVIGPLRPTALCASIDWANLTKFVVFLLPTWQYNLFIFQQTNEVRVSAVSNHVMLGHLCCMRLCATNKAMISRRGRPFSSRNVIEGGGNAGLCTFLLAEDKTVWVPLLVVLSHHVPTFIKR